MLAATFISFGDTMFATIKAADLGPLSGTFTIPRGEVTISGGSQLGKSSLIRALCLALLGTDERGRPLPVDAITDGSQGCAVAVTSHKGTTWSRTVGVATKGADLKRSIGSAVRCKMRPGEEVAEEFKTEKAWQLDALPAQLSRALAAGKRKVHAARLVAVPFAWEALAKSAGGGRELRDVLDGIVGGGESLRSVVAELMLEAGEELEGRDPFDNLKACEAERTEANTQAERAEGATEHAQRQAEATDEGAPADGPTAEAIEAAGSTLAEATAWGAHDDAVERWQGRVAIRVTETEAWDAHKAALATEPKTGGLLQVLADIGPDVRELSKLRQDLANLEGQLEGLSRIEISTSERGQLEQRLNLYEEHAGKCPTCLRKWNKSRPAITEIRKQLEAEPNPEPSDELLALRDKIAEAAGEVAEAESALAGKQAKADRLRNKKREHEEWTLEVAQLGDRPEPLEGDGPTAPDLDRPTDEAAAEAEATLTAKQTAAGAKQAHETHARRAREAANVAAGRLVILQEKATRAAALVDAVRRAPSIRLQRSIGKLGELGPVSFRLPEDGDGVEVLFDGRPHHLASDGHRVYADLCLRLALRRALRMTWFPIFVDSAQDWSKSWPDTLSPSGKPTPVVWLLTTKGEAITVSPGRPS